MPDLKSFLEHVNAIFYRRRQPEAPKDREEFEGVVENFYGWNIVKLPPDWPAGIPVSVIKRGEK